MQLLTRDQAEAVGRRRMRLRNRVERLLDKGCSSSTDNYNYSPVNHFSSEDNYSRKLAGESIGSYLSEGQPVHVITKVHGLIRPHICVPMADIDSHNRIHSYNKNIDFINQRPDGTIEIGSRPYTCIVDVGATIGGVAR